MKFFFSAYIVVLLLPVVAWAQNKGYELGVGRLVVSTTNWDAASSADFKVRFKRRDPAVEEKVGALTDWIGQISKEVDRLKDLLEPLQQKEEQSKIEPGPPLTDSSLEAPIMTELSQSSLQLICVHPRHLWVAYLSVLICDIRGLSSSWSFASFLDPIPIS